MAKVLISAIGVGKENRKYYPTIYKFPDTSKEYETSFIASALCEYLRVDKLFLVGSAKSMWEEVYRYYANAAKLSEDYEYWGNIGGKTEPFNLKNNKIKICDEDLLTINETIDKYLKHINSSASGGSQCFIIDYGLNDSELWNNFDTFMKIGEKINESDEIYLDITHAFRSISLFNYITLDLIGILKFKKAFKLSGLFYGMLDVIKELGYAPVVDLSPLYNITAWARGAYNFINFGNGYLLADLISDSDLSRNIKSISEIVNINYIDNFKKSLDSLYTLMENNKQSDPVVKYTSPYILSFINRFKGIESTGKLQFTLAKWYFDNKRYAQGYICLAESIISLLLDIYRERNEAIIWNETNRKKIKNLIKDKFKEDEEYLKIYEEYESIRKIRNTIAHAGYEKNNNFNEDIKNAYTHLNKVGEDIFNNPAINKIPYKFPLKMVQNFNIS